MKDLINPFIFYNDDELIDISRKQERGLLYEVHISDLHFGATDPKSEYDILKSQFLDKISIMNRIDIISVNGDIFDHKMLSSSDGVFYAIKFIDDLTIIAKSHNATLILIEGTPLHDANQLKLFYHYMEDKDLDIRIINHIQFQYVKGAKILCIPEHHGLPEEEYRKFLYNEYCDQVFGHMTFKGAVYNDQVGTGRLFDIEDFLHSRGPIISGHVHKPGNFGKDFYYTGCPIRYKFGEEEPKGFLIVVMDLDSRRYYVDFNEIISFKYSTVELTSITQDPKSIIEYIDKLKSELDINYIKIKFRYIIDGTNKTVITNYYRNKPDVKLEFLTTEQEAMAKMEAEQRELNNTYGFITDPTLSDEEKFCKYVNIQEGYQFITVDKLREILNEEI